MDKALESPANPSAVPTHDGGIDRDALGGQVRQAVFWRTGTQIVSQTISWTATLIVIRLLEPADYGLFAMAQVMMTFLDFLNGYGFASALIQSKQLARQAIPVGQHPVLRFADHERQPQQQAPEEKLCGSFGHHRSKQIIGVMGIILAKNIFRGNHGIRRM